ncbi:ATP-NAD kinase family protein [Desulfospira joergensenii]|uniref:ATP-NAD kinase family protein n=1 Tax=Desulfospira joergensenii TaxID=53329 RepID=UPI0003B718DA|nr:ATP-NAD kinase family protein [Desulfospira joergensenii]
MKKLGVIVNPVAGIGGRVGLKGSDGEDILEKAIALGARPESPGRAMTALKEVAGMKIPVEILTYPGVMGEEECLNAGLSPIVIGSIDQGRTTPSDTIRAAMEMADAGVDLLLFAGGDGTARNIYNAVGENVSVLGIPAGVKIHSAVYAVNPKRAGQVAAMFLERKKMTIRSSEVMDIDEDAFREGRVKAKLFGYMKVPEEPRFVQSVKSGGARAEKEILAGIAEDIADEMENSDCYFIIGPGTTTRSVMEYLNLENTLLGVDVVKNRKIVASDVDEQQLWDLIAGEQTKIVLTVIGGQGHLFGRGNQQISPRIIRNVGRENIRVIATKEKLIALNGRPLLVDTGDETLNAELAGYLKVTTGYEDYTMCRVGY